MRNEILSFETILAEQNAHDAEQLFELYNSLHFIYAAKMEKLEPVFDIVKQNWQKAVKLCFPLFSTLTVRKNSKNITATTTQWQYLNRGMIGQHLASNNPVGSRIVFLASLNQLIKGQYKGNCDSYQIYYRPQNKYSSRMFGGVSIKMGKELSETIPCNYFEVPFLQYARTKDIQVVEINNGNDADVINFLAMEKGRLYIKAQELDSDDINLNALNERFIQAGLKRTRKIFAARLCSDNSICGLIIINQSSLGLNFSFFENSSELILSKQVCPGFLLQAAQALLYKASQLHVSSPLKFLPVLSDPLHTSIIEKLQGKLTRNYNLFMMLRGGYEGWYAYIDELTNSVFQRFVNNIYEKSI